MYIHASGKLAKHKFTWEQSSELAKHEELDIVYSVIIGYRGMVDCISKQKKAKALILFGLNLVVFIGYLETPSYSDQPILNVKGKFSFWDCSESLIQE
ncbi:MAG: hypothetical protein QM653_09500 [Dysgonomonas sp.]|uniref:hypothetical protein n=1 Tax=Dysgonomonas sp. TaxID=1891233 RepID=UPI0039E67B21